MEEAAPTNSMSGVYQQSPRANAAFRLGELDPPRRFVAAADGSWPAGIPGTVGEPYYDRPAGHWEGTVDWETITEPKFGYNAAQNNNTDGLIDPVTNAVKTQLPPNSRSFILGPLVDGFVPNHVSDAFTRIGYIEKDTRQFVLLGIINGEWTAGLNERSTFFGGGTYPVWDGSSSGFSQVNPNFTLDMALWFRNEMLKGRFVKNVSYNAVGGIPQAQGTDPNAPQPFGGNGVGGGSGEAGQNPDGTGTGTGSGGNPTQGNEQGDPDPGKGPGENDLWGQNPEGEGFVSFKPDFEWYQKNKKKPKGAPENWNELSDDEKRNWINKNKPEERFNYNNQSGKFDPDSRNAIPNIPKPDVPFSPSGDQSNFPNNYDPINDPQKWLPPEDPTEASIPFFPDLEGPISGNDPDDFLPPQAPDAPNRNDYPNTRSGAKKYQDDFKAWENEVDEAQRSNPFLNVDPSGLTPFKVGLNIGRGLLDNAIYGNTDLLFKGLDSATPKYIPDFAGGVGGPEWFKGLYTKAFGNRKLTEIGPLKIFSRDIQYFTPDFNTALKYAGEGGTFVAMPRPDSVRGLKNIWKSPVSRGFDFTKGIETLVKSSDAKALENVTKIVKLGEPGSEEALKALASKVGKTNKVASKAAKFVPFLNWGLAAADVSIRLSQGDYAGAIMGGMSAIPGPVGWTFTALQIGYDVAGGAEKLYGGNITESYISANELGLPEDKDEYIKDMIISLYLQGTHPELLSIIANAMRGKEFSKGQKKWIDNNLEKYVRGFGAVFTDKTDKKVEKIKESYTYTNTQKRILREIRQPLKEIQELPKTQKLKGYRPNFKGKLSPQNTPDVTASKKSDRLVMAKNAEGQAWSVGDKYFKGWETTNRMNHVYARVGESDKFFEQITANNKSDYDRKLQEHLNHLYHNKAMKLVDPDYVSPFDPIKEQETFDNKVNDPLFTKVAKRLKKEIDYEKKPAKAGYPNEAPPKIDPNTGYHPKYGKRYKYDKLDPISAKAMAGAPTGDPEIDANVKRQAQKEDWRSDLKNLWLGAERGDWKKKIEEGMTVSGAKVIKKVISGVGDVDLDILKLGLTGDGEIDPGPGQVWGRAFNHDPNNPSAIDSTDTRVVGPGGWQDGRRNDNTMVNPDSVYHMADTCRSTDEVDDPTDVGTGVRRFGSNSLVHISHGIGLNYKIPGIEFNLNHGLRNASVNGRHDFGHNRTFALHPPGPTDDTIGRGPGAAEYVNGQNVGGYGTALRFWGPNVPRLAALKGVDTTEMDSIKIHAAVSSGSCTHEGEQLQLWYWAGDMEGFKSYHDVKIGSFPKRAHDGWRPTFIKPDGTVADGVSNVIVPHDRSNLIGYESNKLYPFRVQIPEWCRGKNVRFMLYQHTHGAGSAGSGGASGWGVDNIYITSLRFQRHNSIAITGPLDSPEGSNFIRVGNNSNVSSQARIKELNKMLKAARKYMLKQLGFSSLFDSKGDPIVDITPANYYVGRNDYMSTMRKVNARLYDKEHGKGAHAALQKMRDSVGKPPTPKKYTSSRGSGRIRGYKITAKDSKGMTKRAVMYNEFDKEGKNLQEGMTTMALTGILPAAKGVDLTTIQSGQDENGVFTAFSIMGDMTTAEDPTGVGCWFRHPDFDFGNPDRASIQSFHGGTYSGAESLSGSGKEGQVAGYVPRAMRSVRPSGIYSQLGPYQPIHLNTRDILGLDKPRTVNFALDSQGFGTHLDFYTDSSYMATRDIDTSDVDTMKIHAWVHSGNIQSESDKVELFYWAGNKPGFKSMWTGAAYDDGEGHESGHLKNNDGWRRINTKPDGTVDNTVQTRIIDHLRPDGKNGKLSAYTIHLPEWTRGKNSRFIITTFGQFARLKMTSMRFQRNNAIKSPALTKSLTDIETSPFVRVGPTKKNEGGKQRKKKVQKIIDSGLEYTGTKFSKDFPVRTRLESNNLFQKIKDKKINESSYNTWKSDWETTFQSAKHDKSFREWSQQLDDMWNSDWREKLAEGMSTKDTFSYSVSGEEGNQFVTGTGYTEDGIHQLQNIPLMSTVDDPQNVGKALGGGPLGLGYQNVYGAVNQYDSASKEALGQEASGYNQAVTGSGLDNNDNPRLSDYIYPFDREATAAEKEIAKASSKVRGKNDVFRATYPTNVFGDRHKAAPIANPKDLIGLNAFDTIDGVSSYERCGLGIAYGGGFDSRTPRFFVPAAVDTREIDSIEVIGAIAGGKSAGSQLQLFYWSGDKPGFQSLQNVNAHNASQYPPNNRQYDGWRPIAQKPNGEIDSSVSSIIMDGNNLPPGVTQRHIGQFSIKIPEWCRSKNTRFMYLQLTSSGAPRLFSIGYQRRNAITITTTLDDEKASAFVRTGLDNNNLNAKQRKQKIEKMLRASREYMLKSLGYASLFKDEIKIADITDNDFDFQSVMQGSGAFGNSRFNEIISSEKRQAATRRASKRSTSPKKFRGYKRTGRDSKGMTTSAKVNPKDIIGSI